VSAWQGPRIIAESAHAYFYPPVVEEVGEVTSSRLAFPERSRSARHARLRSPPERKASLMITNAFVTPPEATSKPRAPETPRHPA
jgi:hypothetical protein